MLFFKATLSSLLNENFIPGIATTSINPAIVHRSRIADKRKYHTDESVIIEIEYPGALYPIANKTKLSQFGHVKNNYWITPECDKVELNRPCKFRVLSDSEIIERMG